MFEWLNQVREKAALVFSWAGAEGAAFFRRLVHSPATLRSRSTFVKTSISQGPRMEETR